MEDDLQLLCWKHEHYFYSLTVAMPCLVLWGAGIPLAVLFLLFRKRKQLDEEAQREQLGFLYRGYRNDFYFWEIVIMYRKNALIFIAVFIKSQGTITQALVVLLLLIVFFYVNTEKEPFQTKTLNDLETLSLATSMVTIYCGLYFLSNLPLEWVPNDPDLAEESL